MSQALSHLIGNRAGRYRIAGAPEGQDARILADIARQAEGGLIHVASDDVRTQRLLEALGFFAPDLDVVVLPAWDCLPYDRVSPNVEIVARRIDAMVSLAGDGPGRGRLVLVTVNGILQRLSPPESLAEANLSLEVGGLIDIEALTTFAARQGYVRTETVREPGEFALRGGIVDVFPAGAEEPFRLDLFGDEVEAIRVFDPMSQRTTGNRDAVMLRPVAEFALDEASIQRFRAGYRERFGAVLSDDPLYEAVSAGRRHGGMEHWLPLYHERLVTLFDFLPDAAVTLDPRAEEAIGDRLEQIADFYQARVDLAGAAKAAGGEAYKALPPGELYLTEEEWQACLGTRATAVLSPFAAVDVETEAAETTIDGAATRGRDFADARARPDVNVFDAVFDHLGILGSGGRRIAIAAYSRGSRDRLRTVLAEHGIDDLVLIDDLAGLKGLADGAIGLTVLALENGFVAGDIAIVTEQDILGDRLARSTRRKRRSQNVILEASSLNEGDIVVHVDHGIGQFTGLETLEVSGAAHDCLRLVYDGGDKLFLPVENIEVLSRFGSDAANVQLDKLGGAGWQARKARVKKRLFDIADQLLKTAALREVRDAAKVETAQTNYQEFAARFPYTETEDQSNAIDDVLVDLEKGRPMDRLVCGDVGFGKTEVALRAAFVAASNGLQVAVVVPTTLLARQHYRNFTERFQGFPFRIAQLSRLVTAKDTKLIKEELTAGSIDIVIGTQALLAPSIKLRHLGLLIVDEEQHFGVKQKERLKELRQEVHVLTLTATPIPRTLQLALTGVRELSLIATPPVDRLAVRTFVLPYDPVVVREALMREHFRGGQSFYVCPRIEDIAKLEERLRDLVPELKVVSAHGRMGATELEERMSAFYDGQYDILLATNIIESGLDIPRANTLVIHRADMFGLAQLYQLRGRVGRSKQRGYAYLTHASERSLTKTAQQRLHVIETLDSLGAGFQLASYDMDIRGAGNLLGEEQSGQVKEVGVELYQEMLKEAIEAVRGGVIEAEERWSPQINLGMPVLIPATYVADLGLRLSLYRRLADLVDQREIDAFAAELVDRFGALPEEVSNLIDVMSIKQLSRRAGVERVEAGPKGLVIAFRNDRPPYVDRLMEFVVKHAKVLKLRPDSRLVYTRAWGEPKDRLQGTTKLLKNLVALAAQDTAGAKAA